MSINYAWWRKRLKLENCEDYPAGNWMTVREAAEILNLSTMGVRVRYLKGRLRAGKVGGRGQILVLVE